MVKVVIGNVYPEDSWLEPCLKIECKIKRGFDEHVTRVSGFLRAEDDTVLAILEPIAASDPLCHLMAKEKFLLPNLQR